MAVRRPLILDKSDGRVKELPAGERIQEVSIGFTGLNNTGASIAKGVPVFKNTTANEIDVADATDNTKICVGFTAEIIADTETGEIQTKDTLELADWTTISGSATLTVGSRYYLDTTSGMITDDVSSYVAGNIVQCIGFAINTTDLLVQIGEPVLIA